MALGKATTAAFPERGVLRGAWRYHVIRDNSRSVTWWLAVDLDAGEVIGQYRRKVDAEHQAFMLEEGEHGNPACYKC